MTTKGNENLVIQVSPETLAKLRTIAQTEGRPLQTLIDEAIADLIEKRKQSRQRDHVLAVYKESHETFSPLYKKLAE